MENSPSPVVTGNMDTDRLNGLKAFENISRRFAEGFDDSSGSESYGNLLKDLMDNSSLLVSGGLMSAKEILDKIEDLQEHIKQSGTRGLSVADEFNRWLNA